MGGRGGQLSHVTWALGALDNYFESFGELWGISTALQNSEIIRREFQQHSQSNVPVVCGFCIVWDLEFDYTVSSSVFEYLHVCLRVFVESALVVDSAIS